MFRDETTAVCGAAQKKMELLEKNPLGYWLMSILEGLFIGLGSVLMGVVGGVFTAGGAYSTKLVCGCVFAVGLCLVTVAGAELFTGNNFVMAMAGFRKELAWGKIVKLWVVCWLGNLIGSVLTAVVFTATGIGTGDVAAYLANAAATKAAGAALPLFTKAIFCNICVCLAIWCGTKLKSEGAKLAMNFACVMTFVTCGFEHSVANMTFLTIGLLNPAGMSIPVAGVIMNLVIVTLGNMVGGIVCVALPYYLIAREK